MRNCDFMLIDPGRLCAALAIFLIVSLPASRAQESVSISAASVPPRETLDYDVEWRLISAGKVKFQWGSRQHVATPEWEAKIHLETTGIVSRLFRVNDDYTADIGPDLCSLTTFMTAHEGARSRETKVTFDKETRKASYVERDLVKNAISASSEVDIPPCVHDILGGLALLRSLNLEPGKSARLPISDGKKSVGVRVESQGREEVKTPLGRDKAIRYEVFVFNDVLYRRSGHMHIWLTDDARRLPVQIQIRLQFTIGTITLRLEKVDRS